MNRYIFLIGMRISVINCKNTIFWEEQLNYYVFLPPERIRQKQSTIIIIMKRIIKFSAMALLVVLTLTGCKKSYTITVKSNNNEWGSVTGSGTYKDGETVTISAVPATGYYFIAWNDGNAENPRKIVVSGNAEYIATFSDTPGGGTDGALEVSGSISANTTWPDRGVAVDYIIDGRFYVEGNALLTIEPGVTIMFTDNYSGITVEENAGLRMVGTADKPIVLTGPANNPNPGAWDNMVVMSNRNDNQFEYVNFINGGHSYEVVYVRGKLSMKHCTVDNSATNGVTLGDEGVFTAFENNTIKHVAAYPVVLNSHHKVDCLGSGNIYTNNTKNMIRLDDYWLDEENSTTTFTNQGVPYFVSDGINVINHMMVVDPGVEFVFDYEKEMIIGDAAILRVNTGSPSNPSVIFRGLENENGYWKGLVITTDRNTNGGSKLANCSIQNAGFHDEAALFTNEDTRVEISNVTINGSNGYGMSVAIPVDWDTEQYDFSNYHVTVSGLSFSNCAQGNIFERNKEQVYSTMPGAKKLAKK